MSESSSNYYDIPSVPQTRRPLGLAMDDTLGDRFFDLHPDGSSPTPCKKNSENPKPTVTAHEEKENRQELAAAPSQHLRKDLSTPQTDSSAPKQEAKLPLRRSTNEKKENRQEGVAPTQRLHKDLSTPRSASGAPMQEAKLPLRRSAVAQEKLPVRRSTHEKKENGKELAAAPSNRLLKELPTPRTASSASKQEAKLPLRRSAATNEKLPVRRSVPTQEKLPLQRPSHKEKETRQKLAAVPLQRLREDFSTPRTTSNAPKQVAKLPLRRSASTNEKLPVRRSAPTQEKLPLPRSVAAIKKLPLRRSASTQEKNKGGLASKVEMPKPVAHLSRANEKLPLRRSAATMEKNKENLTPKIEMTKQVARLSRPKDSGTAGKPFWERLSTPKHITAKVASTPVPKKVDSSKPSKVGVVGIPTPKIHKTKQSKLNKKEEEVEKTED